MIKGTITMKYFMALSTLAVLSVFFIASCTQCSPEADKTTNLCDGGGGCTSPAVSSSNTPTTADSSEPPTTTSGVSVLVDGVNETNVCAPSTTNLCLNPHDESLINVDVVKGSTWEITLPSGFKEKSKPKPEVELVTYSERDKALVVVTKEKFSGNFEEYVLMNLRKVKDTGARVEATKTVDADGKKFVQLEMMKDDVKIWSLVTTKDGLGYGVSCGGPPPYEPVNTLCSFITTSFVLK